VTDSERDAVRRIAASLADGQPVDWDALRASGALAEREIGALRLLESIRSGRPPSGASPHADGLDIEILEEIGSGSASRVHRALDRALGRPVALKLVRADAIVPEAARERFLAEARALASIDHPNVVRIHSVELVDGTPRLCLELVDGKTLERIVRDDGPFSPEEVARIGIDLCRALAAIHAKGLVHRDVKPSNVMRATGGRTVLLDFGVVRDAGSPDRGPHPGTPVAMAPEQFDAAGETGQATDVYALGVLLYWAVCGRYPVEAASYEELRDLVRAGRRTPLADRRPDVPGDFVSIVEKATATAPSSRFESAGAFERALREFLSLSKGPGRRGRPAMPWIAGAAALIAALAVWVAIASWSGRAPLELDARFFVTRDGVARGLSSGDSVRVGDLLFLEARFNRESHVYVLDEDDAGELFTMFPAPGYEPRNPLRAGTTHRLPGTRAGKSHDWLVSSQGGGAETILVVAASEPIEHLESFLRGVPAVKPEDASPARKVDVSTRAALYRGIGKTAPAGAAAESHVESPSPAARLEDWAAALAREDATDRAVKLIRLRNAP